MPPKNQARKSTATRSISQLSGGSSSSESSPLGNISTNTTLPVSFRNQARKSTATRNSLQSSSSPEVVPSKRTQLSMNQTSSISSTPAAPSTSGIRPPRRIITQQSSDSSDSDSEDDNSVLPTPSSNSRKRHAERRRTTSPDSDSQSDGDASESIDSDEIPVGDRNRGGEKKVLVAGRRKAVPGGKRKASKGGVKVPAKQQVSKKLASSESSEEDQTPSKVVRKKIGAVTAVHHAGKQFSPLKQRDVHSLAYKCVYFLLIADQKKFAIKRQDILKNVFVNQDSKLYTAVINKASHILQKTFGLELIETVHQKGSYMIVNILDQGKVEKICEFTELQEQQRGLILYLLTVIFMNENSINEADLWKALKPLGIDVSSRKLHPIFGDVRKYITIDLVKQMYLEYKCINKEASQYEFTWGARADQEVDKMTLLKFACQVRGDTDPKDWILQYKDAKKGIENGNTASEDEEASG